MGQKACWENYSHWIIYSVTLASCPVCWMSGRILFAPVYLLLRSTHNPQMSQIMLLTLCLTSNDTPIEVNYVFSEALAMTHWGQVKTFLWCTCSQLLPHWDLNCKVSSRRDQERNLESFCLTEEYHTIWPKATKHLCASVIQLLLVLHWRVLGDLYSRKWLCIHGGVAVHTQHLKSSS